MDLIHKEGALRRIYIPKYSSLEGFLKVDVFKDIVRERDKIAKIGGTN